MIEIPMIESPVIESPVPESRAIESRAIESEGGEGGVVGAEGPIRRYRIVRLQVQTDPLKIGRAPLRVYDPAPIESVPRIEISPAGVVGLADGLGSVLDVHHIDHPATRDPKGVGGVTLMGTGDYDRLRARYGQHLTEGIAGETILLDAPGGFGGLDMPSEFTVYTQTGPLLLTGLVPAEPCVEFCRFCLQRNVSSPVDDEIRRAMRDLDGGARGYRGMAAGSAVIALGDEVTAAWRLSPVPPPAR